MSAAYAAVNQNIRAPVWPDEVERVVICIGAQKAATSWLFDMAKHDSQICVPQVKEVGYWNLHDLNSAPVMRVAKQRKRAILKSRAKLLRDTVLMRDRSAARAQLDKWTSLHSLQGVGASDDHQAYVDFLTRTHKGEAVVFEATPSYTLLPSDRYAEMAALHPDTRLLFMMRDPVERLWSDCTYYFRKRKSEGGHQEREIIEFFKWALTARDEGWYQHSDYVALFDRLDQAGVLDDMYFLFFETLHSDVEQAHVKNVFELELSQEKKKRVNSTKAKIVLPPDAKEMARKVYAPVYDMIAERFGDRVPAKWSEN